LTLDKRPEVPMRHGFLPTALSAALLSASASAQVTSVEPSAWLDLVNPAGLQQVAARQRRAKTRHVRAARRNPVRTYSRAPAAYPGGQGIYPSAPQAPTGGPPASSFDYRTGAGGGY
jgi:hypothetical protein